MSFLLFLPSYFRWHYTKAWKDLARNSAQFLSFLVSFFSIDFLLKTLFAPWRRMGEKYQKGFDPEGFFSAFIVNTIMRLVGFTVRAFAILVGSVAVLLSIVAMVLLFVFWAIFPLAVLFLFTLGLTKIFS